MPKVDYCIGANGCTAAAPAINAMNSRRIMSDPKLGETAS
jgi:hypothetical protein